MTSGIFCISIDTELLWGRKDLNYSKFIEKTKKEREIIKKILKLFKKYQIGATWAIVGKLYEKDNELWSGIDIINMIKKDKNQEIASHSYSHEDFYKINKKKAISELNKNVSYSFIYPRNHIKYLNLLKKIGYSAYRGIDETSISNSIILIAKLFLSITPKTNKPSQINGLINIPGSMYFLSARGMRKFIPLGLKYKRAVKGIDKAIKNNEIFHLWFHPIDFADNQNEQFSEFEKILVYANKKKRSGVLKIEPMIKIAKEFKLKNINS